MCHSSPCLSLKRQSGPRKVGHGRISLEIIFEGIGNVKLLSCLAQAFVEVVQEKKNPPAWGLVTLQNDQFGLIAVYKCLLRCRSPHTGHVSFWCLTLMSHTSPFSSKILFFLSLVCTCHTVLFSLPASFRSWWVFSVYLTLWQWSCTNQYFYMNNGSNNYMWRAKAHSCGRTHRAPSISQLIVLVWLTTNCLPTCQI